MQNKDRFLFRAYNPYKKEWIKHDYPDAYPLVATSFYSDECDWIVMQCTGLRDKNGVLIFEGDIVQPDKEIFIEIFGVVKFGEHFCCHSFAQYGLYIKWSGDYGALRENIVDWNERVEIVGNVYDNPELLKGAE